MTKYRPVKSKIKLGHGFSYAKYPGIPRNGWWKFEWLLVALTFLYLIIVSALIVWFIREIQQVTSSIETNRAQAAMFQQQYILAMAKACSLEAVVCPAEAPRRPATAGKASWLRYERPDTCAALLWPKQTQLKVTAGDRWIVCTRRDSGPYIPGRIVDLSLEQFGFLADPKVGLIDVTVQPI